MRCFPLTYSPVVDSRCNYSPAYSLGVGRCTGQAQRSQRASLNLFNAGPTDIQITCRHRLTPAAREHFKFGILHVTLCTHTHPPPQPPSQSLKKCSPNTGDLWHTERSHVLILGPPIGMQMKAVNLDN